MLPLGGVAPAWGLEFRVQGLEFRGVQDLGFVSCERYGQYSFQRWDMPVVSMYGLPSSTPKIYTCQPLRNPIYAHQNHPRSKNEALSHVIICRVWAEQTRGRISCMKGMKSRYAPQRGKS